MKKYIYFPILFSTLYFLLSTTSVAQAHTWRLGTPLVPCGLEKNVPGTLDDESKPCTRCDTFHLIKHVIDFGFLVVLPVGGTLILLYAGVLYLLSGANPSLLGKAKGIFTNTLYATLVIVLTWIIVNTILVNLGGSISSQWYSFQCVNP